MRSQDTVPSVPRPDRESERQALLDSYGILDIERTPTFQRVVHLAATMLKVPTAAISLISHGRQWFLAKTGLSLDETPREHAFCAHAICGNDIFVVEDASQDPRFRSNPLVTAEGGIRFYAGAPLEASDGLSLGALCAIDSKPRTINQEQRETLRELAQIVLDEFELRRALEQLREEVNRREALEAELLEERNRALVLAQETSRLSAAKSNFMANMSHEIRTPMNGVIGMSELLLDTALDDQQRDSVRTVLRSAEGLLGVLNDILDFSKIEAGRLELEHASLNLELLVEEVCEIQMSRISDRPVELSQLVSLPSPVILGDETRLRQILNNLIGNATKFTERGFVCVTVSQAAAIHVDPERPAMGACQQARYQHHRVLCRPMLGQSQEWLVLQVQDTGIGMSAEQLERLTQAYAQADDTITRRFGGTGLGLTISHRLIEAMQGGLSVSSTLGEGTCFSIYLPAAYTEQQFLTGRSSDDWQELLKDCRILVVDDLPLNTEIISRMLDRVGCITQRAAGAEQALALLASERFDLVVTDFMMPGLSGADLVQRYRQSHPGRELPFVLASSAGYVARGQADEALFVAAISKPIRASRLIAAVLLALQQGAAGSSGTPALQPVGREAPPKAGPADARSGELPTHSLYILLAEDNPTNAKVAGGLLDQLGHRWRHVEDGQAAVAAACAEAFDLILMDVQMPVMSGLEATSRIRQQAGPCQRTPIVALTANAMPGDRETFLSAGMADYLSKPFRRADLVALLERVSQRLARDGGPSIGSEGPSRSLAAISEFDAQYWSENFGSLAVAGSVLRSSLDLVDQEQQRLTEPLTVPELKALVHRLGGGLGMLGYLRFSDWCLEQEDVLSSGRLQDTQQLQDRLRMLMAELQQDLQTRVGAMS